MPNTEQLIKKGKNSQYLLYYSLFCIYFFVTLPVFILASLLLKLIQLKKYLNLLIEWYVTKLEIWYEFIDLYKTTGYKYRPEEYRYEIYTDKRNKTLQEKERYIEGDFPFFDNRTIIYFEPFDCPALKNYIHNNINSINASLKVKKQVLFFWPVLYSNSKNSSIKNIIFNNVNEEINKDDTLFKFMKEPEWTSQLLNEWLEPVQIDGPCFLQYVGEVNPKTNKALYYVFYLPYNGRNEIKDALKYYMYQLWDNHNRIFFQKINK